MAKVSAVQVGVAALVVGNAFAIWSALNPSPFTMKKFAANDRDRAELRRWQNVALVVIAGVTFGTLLLFRNVKEG